MSASPDKLMATNCAAACDGGSVVLLTVDPEQNEHSFHLDWSFAAQANGTTQLYVNGMAVLKGSPLETVWLRLLADADVRYNDPEAPDEDYSDAVRGVRDYIVSRIMSEAYQQGRG